LWRTIDAINEHPDFAIKFPIDDPDALKDMESEFARAHQRRYKSWSWRGNVGAVDGVDFAMRNPGKAVPNPRRYYVERKGHYCLLCMAVCDAHRRFTDFDVSFASSTHDSLAWAGSELGARVQAGELPHPYFINGDSAFTCTNHMIVPMNESDFDFYQSSNRMVIECAFGVLVRRWGVFWRPLEVRFDRRAPLVGCAMRLHNYCIDRKIGIEMRQVAGASEIQPRVWAPTPHFGDHGEPVELLDTADHSAAAFVGNCARRNQLKRGLEEAGLRRPGESARASALRQARGGR
jgi:hypothetical protein